MTRRCVIVLLAAVGWTPPGIDPVAWRSALAEDMVDLLATLAEVDVAIAAPAEAHELAAAIRWPTMAVYPAARPAEALAAAAADGYDQAAVLVSDAPDLPAMLVGKLLRPLGSQPVAVAPATTGGLLGIAARLSEDVTALTAIDWHSPPPAGAAIAASWHRLDSPAGFAQLDPALEGWDVTRALLS